MSLSQFSRVLASVEAERLAAKVRWFSDETDSLIADIRDHFDRIDQANARIDAVLADYRSIR